MANNTEQKRVARSITLVFFASGARWVLGCARIVMIAFLFGATFVYDAYLVAFAIPEMVAGLLVGVIAVTFIPFFTEYVSKEGEEKAWDFASNLINIIFVVGVSLTVLMIGLAPFVVRLVAPGFNETTFQLAVRLVIILFPLVLIISLAELTTRLSHAYQHFALPTFGTVLEVAVVILCLLFFSGKYGIFSLAFGLLLGAVVRLLAPLPILWRKFKYYRFSLNIRLPAIRRLHLIAGPMISCMLFLRIGTVIERLLASTLKEGAISILGYAMTLTQVPSEIFVGSIGIVLFPLVSRYASEGKMEDFKSVLSKGVRMGNFILFPIAVLFIFFGGVIIASLLERGQFNSAITRDTSIALAVYALSLFVTAVYFFSSQACYALQEIKPTLKFAIFAMVIDVILKLASIHYLSFVGLALATSIALVIHSGFLVRFIKRKIGPFDEKIIFFSSLQVLSASLLMAGVCWVVMRALPFETNKLLRLVFLLGTAGTSYLAFSYLLRSQELGAVKNLLFTRAKQGAAPRQ